MEKISAIFDEVQRIPSASNKACIPKLNKILATESDEGKLAVLSTIWRGCLDQCLLCAKKENVVDKLIDFLASFVSNKSTMDLAYISCVDHLVQRLKAVNKVIRLRGCQMVLRIIVGTIESDKLVSDSTLKKMTDMLLPRLKDKVPGVRVLAVKALGNLQSEGDGITEELLRLLQRDGSKEVRIAAVDCICLSKTTLPLVIARVKDVKPEVRIAVYNRLSAKGMVSAKNMDASSAATIVRYGLGDRDPKVKESCKMLVLKWLADYNNDVPKFLRLMDFEMYEEEAESLGSTVMEMVERGVAVSQDLCIAVRQHSPDWEQPVSKMVASEILWVHIRCAYAQKNMSPVALADFVDALVPDMIRLCSLLQEARKPALYSSTKYQMIVRYLLRMTAFLDTSDVCGCKELVKVCQEMVSDTNLPEMLVDPMLNAWLISSSFESSERSILAAVKLSQTVANPMTLPKSAVRMTSDIPLPGDSDDEDDEEAVERVRILSIIRSLQILSWSLQLNIGARDVVKGKESYEEITDFVMECLQQPCADLRGLAVKCLGLLALTSEEKCKDLHEIIFQVARNDIEEGEIRSQALESLVDMATVYEQLYQNDNALTQFLIRLQEGGEPALLRVGAEGSAKLLFSGRLSEPKLFSNLLKFFFLPKLAGSTFEVDKDEDDGDLVEDAFLGSTSRLQQILSVFFQSFFVGGRARDTIAFLCVSDLIADLAMLVRDGELDPCDVSKISNHLLALCDNIKLQISEVNAGELSEEGVETNTHTADSPDRARDIFRARLSAAICREILKMGCSSTAERAAVKEFVKALGSLSPSSWINKNTARTVLSVVSTIYQSCSLEKASQRIIVEKIGTVVEEVGDFTDSALLAEEEKARDVFYGYAPGLADMMELMKREVDELAPCDLRAITRAFVAADTMRQDREKENKSKKIKDNEDNDSTDDDNEDEEEDEDDDQGPQKPVPVPTGRSGPARGSKVAAAGRISAQLADANT